MTVDPPTETEYLEHPGTRGAILPWAPPSDRTVHYVPDGAPPAHDRDWRALCERLTHGGRRPAAHAADLFTDDPASTTCRECLSWMHA